MQRRAARLGACALLMLWLRLAGCGAARIIHPAEDAVLQYIPDIPLWVRLERAEGECFDIRLDGESATVSCEADTILDAWPDGQRLEVIPGRHSLEVVPLMVENAAAGDLAATSTIFHVVGFGSNSHDIPQWMASPDGLHIELPAVVEGYHRWWYGQRIWMRTYWRGVVSHKSPADQWNYQEILHDLKPTVVLELGTRFGGSTLYFADVMRTVHRSGTRYKILTVDIDRASVDGQVFEEAHVEVLTAPSASARMQERVRALRLQYPGPMFVIHDADHSADNVTLELQMVAPLLQNDDYVIVEDTNLDGHDSAVAPGWGPSPYDAIVNFMAMNRQFFRRDLAREKKWGFTQSMNGFLIVTGAGEGYKGNIVNPLSADTTAALLDEAEEIFNVAGVGGCVSSKHERTKLKALVAVL